MERKKVIFGKQRPAVAPKIINQSIDQSNYQKPRKKRSDAKHDIKFKLSADDKQFLKLRARDHRLSLTAFASMIAKSELPHDREIDFFDYDNSGDFVHVTLEDDYFEMAITLSIEWDMSKRKVIHRIIKDYIWRSKGSIKIVDYSRGRLDK